MNNNLLLNVDSYKTSHYLQYPSGAEYVSSYIESRGGDYTFSLFFGLQMFIKSYLTHPITRDDINEAEQILAAHGVPFNRPGWEYILETHQGYLPIEIQAIPEGTVLPVANVLVQACNTDPNCAWLTSYLETALLRAVWYPTTVATRSRYCRHIIQSALEDTTGSQHGLDFKLHDFGARGVSSMESAAIGGAAHLLSFMGTDTVSAILALRRYYHADMPGFSIPATEHSTITCWGRENEATAYANMLDQFAGSEKLVAIVSDSYDLFNAIDNIWGEALREQVIHNGGTIVIRPDSGNPVEIVCESILRLMEKFGYHVNHKGYRVLPDYIRVIQGDGISPTTIEQILEAMKHNQLSAENIAFGMGGELLQNINRDTMQFAMKASAIRINGEWRDVYKQPVTDNGKQSKRGRLALIKNTDGEFHTIREADIGDSVNLLQTVYRDGRLLRDEHFNTIRQRSFE
ncbi:MAG: nicotinate phosphoribosyltransferase [Gammaproteobacteria bacterium]|nr:nicotinate phosphoribosyltransferase [Gammaproteobacteria bacterium]